MRSWRTFYSLLRIPSRAAADLARVGRPAAECLSTTRPGISARSYHYHRVGKIAGPGEKRHQELVSEGRLGSEEYREIEDSLVAEPFVFSVVTDRVHNAQTLLDTGCNIMAAVDSRFVRRNRLSRVAIPPREINAYDDKPNERVNHLIHSNVNIGGVDSMIWMYEVRRLEQDILLGLPWLSRMCHDAG